MRVYLDYAATTPMDPRILEILKEYYINKFGNPSSLHRFGIEAREKIEESRDYLLKFINGEGKIVFTSGGTESDNLAIKGVAFAHRKKGKHIISTKIEHHAVLHTLEYLEKHGFEITLLDVDKEGFVLPESVEDAIREDTILVSVMHANNEIGTIEPIEEIGRICKEHGVLFHTDAVQSFGKLEIDVKKMNIDLLSASSHKIYGPKGVGMLYIRDGINLEPIIHGGEHEFGLRAGTENTGGIIGFAEAVKLCEQEMEKERERESKLRDKLIDEILSEVECSYLNGPRKNRLSGNANLRFDFIEGESLLLYLDSQGIAVSTGSACSSKSLEPSHVLTAIGLEPHEAHGSIRVSLGRFTKEEEINYAIEKIKEGVAKLRDISPFKKGWE